MEFDAKNQIILETVAQTSCEELFDAYGVALERRPSDSEKGPGTILLCGIVGFTGSNARGTCILATSGEPLSTSSPPDTSPRDWIAELSNQLVGRIKNKLLARGVEVYLSTPVVMRGEHIAPCPRFAITPSVFGVAAGGSVYVWTEIETKPGTVLAEEETSTDHLVEGEAMMF